MGPLPRPVGVCEGSEMRLTRRVLSPIIFSLSLSAASAQNLRSTGWKNRKPICCPPTGTSAKRGSTVFTERIAFLNFKTPFWRSLSAGVHNRIQPAGQRMGPASYGQFQHSAPRRHRKQRGEKAISPAGKADHSFQGRTNARVQVCYAAKRGGFLQKQS